MKKGTIPALMLAIAMFAHQSMALEFTRTGGTFGMVGQIKAGDADRFLDAFLQWNEPPAVFHIDSEGGDVVDAMLIGRFIRASQIPVWSGHECHSACVFVFVAGVERMARGDIGLHRPYYSPEYFSSLSSAQAAKSYERVTKLATDYLSEMGVSSAIVGRMFRADSGSLDILSKEEANKAFGYRQPFYDEWIAAKCGRFTGEDAEFMEAIRLLERLDPKTELGRKQILQNFQAIKRENPAIYRVFSDPNRITPLRDAWHAHAECVKRAEDKHVRAFFKGVKKSAAEG